MDGMGAACVENTPGEAIILGKRSCDGLGCYSPSPSKKFPELRRGRESKLTEDNAIVPPPAPSEQQLPQCSDGIILKGWEERGTLSDPCLQHSRRLLKKAEILRLQW